jgi:8-amino-7-oxononanoate synthase
VRGAAVKRFAFEDVEDLKRLLREGSTAPRLVCIDGVNSMTGNAADVVAFARVAREHDALLYVDDAHGFGVIGERADDELSPYGKRGNGIMRHFDESYDHVIFVSGLSKSYSSLAAFIACPPELKRLLKTAAPPYLYSGPSPVASLATTIAGLEVNETRGDAIRADLWRKTATVLDCLDRLGAHTPEPLRLPDHRGAARAARGHRRRRALPVRERHLRDAGRLPARPGARSASGSRSRPRTRTPRSSSSSTCSAGSRTGSTCSPHGRR